MLFPFLYVSTTTFYRSFTHIQSINSHVNVYLINLRTRFFRKLNLKWKNLFAYFVRIFSRGIASCSFVRVIRPHPVYILRRSFFITFVVYFEIEREKWKRGHRKTKKGERYLGSVISSVKDTGNTDNGVPTEKKIGLRDPFKV